MDRARSLIRNVCQIAGHKTWVDELRRTAQDNGLASAVKRHDTGFIFDWLMHELSLQGISDAVAEGYIDQHGNVTWADIHQALASGAACGKLDGYWTFSTCGYRKDARTCSVPEQFDDCPLPRHPLRNGRLNQTAYSLFLFMRDVAGGDVVKWIDLQIKCQKGDLAKARVALIEPLRHVYGISNKVTGMALAGLLMSAGPNKPRWFDVGTTFIAVDTLVHNFLHRTGILHQLDATHAYGPGCYQPDGCADVLGAIAETIDARRFNPAFPKVFARFVQHAVWRYCTEAHLNICNGNQVDDRAGCTNAWCRLYSRCERRILRPNNR